MNERKQRGLGQRLYLLDAEYSNDPAIWKFVVRGSTGTPYNLTIGKSGLKCNCFDCRKRNAVCKHLYFVVGRVARSQKLLDEMDGRLDADILDKVTPYLVLRFSEHEHTPPKDVEVRDTTCSICYEDLGKLISACSTCNNGFHKECIDIWICNRQVPTCPMCRSSWQAKGTEDDVIADFSKLTITKNF